MKTMTKALATVALGAALLTATGCQRGIRLDTRTYTLKHLDANTAESIVQPYVYKDRKDGPSGTMSAAPGVLTVRETPDNLDKIQRVLDQYDVPRPDVRLHFQLIEADGFTGTDPAIAPVEAQLRKIFQFKGYRLVGEAMVGATQASHIGQRLPDGYTLDARVYWSGPSTIRVQELNLVHRGSMLLQTTVNIHPGQTLVVGSAAEGGNSTATLLLTLRAEETGDAGPPAGK